MPLVKEIIQSQHWASWVGFILLALGTIFSFYGSFRSSEEEKKELNKIITGKNETIDAINSKIATQAVTLDKLRRENTELNTLVRNDTRELLKNFTGSESYCTVTFMNTTNPDVFLLSILNSTPYPLKDVTVRIYDLNNPHPLSFESVAASTVPIGNINGNSVASTNYELRFDRANGFSVNFFFTSNGPNSSHLIRKQYVHGKWIMAQQIRVDWRIISTEIDPLFSEQDPKILFK